MLLWLLRWLLDVVGAVVDAGLVVAIVVSYW